jgi:hypothetical protein
MAESRIPFKEEITLAEQDLSKTIIWWLYQIKIESVNRSSYNGWINLIFALGGILLGMDYRI